MPDDVTRRRLLAMASAAALLAGCSPPYPDEQAEREYPPIGEIVEADGLRVHLWRSTPTDPALAARRPAVLIHGASGNLRDFTFDVAPLIAKTRPVIAVDRPGFGYTDRPADGADNPAVQARVLRRAVESLGVERPLLLGHSYGAAVAMAWAVEAEDRVGGVVPVSGVTMPYRGAGRVFSALGLSSLATWAYTEYLKSTIDDGGVERFLARAFNPQPIPAGYADYVGAPLALRQATLDANGADLENVNRSLLDISERYAALTLPVEAVHGSADFIDAEKQSGRLVDTLRRGRLALLPGVGHMAHHAAPDALIAALDRAEAGARA